MKDICKATNSIKKSTVGTTAYLRALGESKGLAVEKFRAEVQEELKDQEGDSLLHYIVFMMLKLLLKFRKAI